MESQSLKFTVLATSLGFVLVQLDVSIINVALATIGTRLHTSVLGLQWIVDAYTLAFASLLLSAGSLSDRIGARRMFILGLASFTTASILCGLAMGSGTLIAARILQGIGAAALVPSSLALLSRSCGDNQAIRDWAVGLWTAAGSAGLAAGPLLGGVMVDLLGWRSIFLVNPPIGLLGIWLTCRFIPRSCGSERSIDWSGQALAVIALLSLTATVIEAHAVGWTSRIIQGGVLTLATVFMAFLMQEQRSLHPMLPLAFFRRRNFSGATAVGFILNLTLYGLLFVLGLYFQRTKHWSAWLSGVAFLPLPIVLGMANLLADRVSLHIGTRATMTAGLLLAGCGTAALTGIAPNSRYAIILCGLILIPAGIGVTVPVMTAVLLGSVEQPRAGVASGVLNAVRQAGGAVGVALLGGLPTRTAFCAGTLLLIGAAMIAASVIRCRKPAQHPAGNGCHAPDISG